MAGDAPTITLERAAQLLGAMSRALEGTRLLGSEHPATRRACEEAAAVALSSTLITVARAGFQVNAIDLPASQSWRLLHERLRALDAAVLALHPPITINAVRALVSALGNAHTDIATLNTAACGMVHITPIDYSRLATTGGDSSQDTLTSLISSMLLSPTPAGERAASIESRFAPGQEGAFSSEFARAAAGIEALPAADQPAALDNLRPLVATLGDRFRDQLLNPTTQNPASWRVLASVVDALPVDAIQRSLSALSDKPVQLSVEAAAVFAKLAATLPPDSPAWSAARTAKDVAGEVLCADDADLAERLESVLRVHSSDDFSPQDYRDRIVALASSSVAPANHLRSTNEFEPETERAQYAMVLAAIAAHRPSSTAIIEQLGAYAAPLLASEGPALFLELASGTPAIKALLRTPAFFAAAIASPRCTPHDQTMLTASWTSEEVAGFLSHLAASPSKPARVAAVALLTSLDDGSLQAATRGCSNPSTAFAALALVQALPRHHALALCHAFASHATESIRAEALRVISTIQAPEDAWIMAALNDPAESVAHQALHVLSAHPHGDDLVARAITEHAAPDGRFDLLAQSLVSRDTSLPTAARVLVQLSSSPNRAHAALADRLAAHLRPHKSHAAVAASLRRYRLSFSRIIALFFPEGAAPNGRKNAA